MAVFILQSPFPKEHFKDLDEKFEFGWVGYFHFPVGLERMISLMKSSPWVLEYTLQPALFHSSPSPPTISFSLSFFFLSTAIFNSMIIQNRIKREQKAIFASHSCKNPKGTLAPSGAHALGPEDTVKCS